MTIALEKFFRPESSAISHVGFHPDIGVVVRYHSGSEYVIHRSTKAMYAEMQRTPSVGAMAAFVKQNGEHTFLRCDGPSHFPTEEAWMGYMYHGPVVAAYRRKEIHG